MPSRSAGILPALAGVPPGSVLERESSPGETQPKRAGWSPRRLPDPRYLNLLETSSEGQPMKNESTHAFVAR
jgi:hypothetical protein